MEVINDIQQEIKKIIMKDFDWRKKVKIVLGTFALWGTIALAIHPDVNDTKKIDAILLGSAVINSALLLETVRSQTKDSLKTFADLIPELKAKETLKNEIRNQVDGVDMDKYDEAVLGIDQISKKLGEKHPKAYSYYINNRTK